MGIAINAERLSLLLDIMQTLILLLSFIGLIWQLRQFNQSLQSSIYSRTYDYFIKINEIPIGRPHIVAPLINNQKFHDLTDDEKDTYCYLFMVFAFYEHIFLLFKQGLVDYATWKTWERWLVKAVLPSQIFEVFWEIEHSFFIPEFTKYINQEHHRYNHQKAIDQTLLEKFLLDK